MNRAQLVPIMAADVCDFCRLDATHTITRANGPRVVCAHHGTELARGIDAEIIALYERRTSDKDYLLYMFAAYREAAAWTREISEDDITRAEVADMWEACANFFTATC